jgi:hypothetical protein
MTIYIPDAGVYANSLKNFHKPAPTGTGGDAPANPAAGQVKCVCSLPRPGSIKLMPKDEI